MRGAWPVAQIRAAEDELLATVPDGSLMAKAAFALAVEAVRITGFAYGARVVLLVGVGNNGGDALYAGALLAHRGAAVQAVLSQPSAAHPAGLAAFREAGGRVVPLSAVGDCDLVIDGLVGIGATGPLRESLVPLAEFANACATPVLAVDIPSGISPDTGEVDGVAVEAAVTLTMGALKPGLLVGDGRLHSGRIEVVDIGLGPLLPAASVWELDERDVADALASPRATDDKYTRGVVGVAAGSSQYPGAALLTTSAARLTGVGAVRYAGPVAEAVVRAFPDVIVSPSVEEAGRTQAWIVGPGLGSSPEAFALVEAVLGADVPAVVDADGLNLLAGSMDPLVGRTAPTVLTPHDREFERLFGPLGADRLGAARRAARDTGCVVLLKGFATVVADPSGQCFVNPTGHPALATAGSGDVLSGLIGGLLATGLSESMAAAVGAWLHGRAGATAEAPVTATDLPDALRTVLRTLT